jgi:hypothetical protein
VLIIIWSPWSNWDGLVGRFWGATGIWLDQDIIVFRIGQVYQPTAPSDAEKSGIHIFIDRDGTRDITAFADPPYSSVQRSISRQAAGWSA